MRILHLGFEDHRRPGAGGGSARNREVNRRLATEHEITVVCAAYRGARPRVEDGVRYRHVGLARGWAPSLLSYFAALPAVVRRHAGEADLVVEEFAGPWASLGVGRWTSTPTVGSVQWFFPDERAHHFRLPSAPVVRVAEAGARSHPHLVTVSEPVAARLRTAAPDSEVTVAGLGLDHDALRAALVPPPERQERRLVFLGRLAVEQKGIDTLLEALALLPTDVTLDVAGDGDDGRVRHLVATLGLSSRVRLLGRVDGVAKWRFLAAGAVAVLPSRYETFGLTVLEAMAVGTPVVTTAVPALPPSRPELASVVPASDAPALAAAVTALLADPVRARAVAQAAQEYAGRQGWDDVAATQAAVYDRATRTASRRRR